jgi:hypothetical protein
MWAVIVEAANMCIASMNVENMCAVSLEALKCKHVHYKPYTTVY